MKYQSSLLAEKTRARGLQIVSRLRNKAGKFLGRKRIVMGNKRKNGKAGRYSITQG